MIINKKITAKMLESAKASASVNLFAKKFENGVAFFDWLPKEFDKQYKVTVRVNNKECSEVSEFCFSNYKKAMDAFNKI